MSDRRLVQCFGIKRQPGKPDKVCGRRYAWAAKGATAGNFGPKGAQACPHCGTAPDFRHPLNRYLNRELTAEEAEAAMPAFLERLEREGPI